MRTRRERTGENELPFSALLIPHLAEEDWVLVHPVRTLERIVEKSVLWGNTYLMRDLKQRYLVRIACHCPEEPSVPMGSGDADPL